MEIERKFLLSEPPQETGDTPHTRIAQGYLVLGEGEEARLRRRDDTLCLTVKAGRGRSRSETEIPLGEDQFEALWPLTAGRRIDKVRHELALPGGLVAEVDVYAGALDGLLVAEVEFPDEEAAEAFSPPPWFGREVTDDDAYKNRALAVDGRPD